MREQYDILKKNLISTINPHDLAVLRHPQHALLYVTAKVIFAHIIVLHGTLDNADYVQLLGTVNNPMTATDTVSSIVATHRLVHQQLAAAQQPINNYQQCLYCSYSAQHSSGKSHQLLFGICAGDRTTDFRRADNLCRSANAELYSHRRIHGIYGNSNSCHHGRCHLSLPCSRCIVTTGHPTRSTHWTTYSAQRDTEATYTLLLPSRTHPITARPVL